MIHDSARRRFACAIACVMLAGCGGGSLTANPSSQTQSAIHPAAGYRLFRAPPLPGQR